MATATCITTVTRAAFHPRCSSTPYGAQPAFSELTRQTPVRLRHPLPCILSPTLSLNPAPTSASRCDTNSSIASSPDILRKRVHQANSGELTLASPPSPLRCASIALSPKKGWTLRGVLRHGFACFAPEVDAGILRVFVDFSKFPRSEVEIVESIQGIV